MKAYGLENVKAFTDTGLVELAPITIFVGQNSCGKSSFIRFPAVLSQTAQNEEYPLCLHTNQNELVDFGGFEDVVHNHLSETFGFYCSYNLSEIGMDPREFDKVLGFISAEDDYYPFTGNNEIREVTDDNETLPCISSVRYKVTYSRKQENNSVVVDRVEIFFDDELAFTYTLLKRMNIYVFHQYKTIRNNEVLDIDQTIDVLPNKIDFGIIGDRVHSIWNIISRTANISPGDEKLSEILNIIRRNEGKLIKHYLNRLQYNLDFSNEIMSQIIDNYNAYCVAEHIISQVSSQLYQEMMDVIYVGPFRNNPERIYRQSNASRNIVGKDGKDISGLLYLDIETGEASLQNKVSQWFERTFGYRLVVKRVEGTEYYQVLLKDIEFGNTSNIMDVGYGISQVLPIVLQMAGTIEDSFYTAAEGRIHIIEQPELHLHPAAQSKLAELFAESIAEEGNHNTLLIETHSEHLIRALQLLIADPEYFLTKDMVKIYYVEKEMGGSVIKEMKLNEYGQFKERWPAGFFDEAHVMSRKLTDAVVKRKGGVAR